MKTIATAIIALLLAFNLTGCGAVCGDSGLAYAAGPSDLAKEVAKIESDYRAQVSKNALDARWGHRESYLEPLNFPRLRPEENTPRWREGVKVPVKPSPAPTVKRLAELYAEIEKIDAFTFKK